MGDQNQYQKSRDLPYRADIQSSLREIELSPDELMRVEKNQELLSECFPELLPHLQELIDLGMIKGLHDVRVTRLKVSNEVKPEHPPIAPSEKVAPSVTEPKIIATVTRNSIHPITGNPGYDVLTIQAHNHDQLKRSIEKAIEKEWHPCPVTENIDLSATLFKIATNKE